nr:hypothetical protein CKG001_30700 [Bdellovibrio sp. CKG001]
MFAKLSLRAKLLTGFVGISLLLLVVGGIGWWSNSNVVSIYSVITNQNLPNVQALGRIRYRAQEVNRTMLRAVMAKNPNEYAMYEKQFEESLQIYSDFTKKYLETPFLPGEEALFNKVDDVWKKYVSAGERVLKLAAHEDQSALAQKVLDEEVRDLRNEHVASLDALLKFHEEEVRKSKASAEATSRRGEILVILTISIGFIFASVLGFLFANSLAGTLGRISGDISGAAEQTSSAGTQLSAASQQLSSGSSEAAASLEETVASLEELSSMVKLNADHAKEANALSAKSRDSAEEGEREINKLIGAMEDIASGSKKIEEIITVIDDIAFQTNLLALNAAVEAARAGEQGKGFAVVAEAVRNLAQRSAAAAKDINSLIKENVSKSENGARVASQSGTVLHDIVMSVKKVADLNSEISVASQEQSTGLEQISKAMNQLDQATQGNAASSEEVAASSEEMSSQAVLLADLVTDLRVLINGVGATKSREASRPIKKSQPPVKAAFKPTLAKHPKKEAEDILPLEDSKERKIGNVSGF